MGDCECAVAAAADAPDAGPAAEQFADAAARLAGVAGAVLGWSPDAFWRATPVELAGVLAVLTGRDSAIDLPGRAMLARLQAQFPD